MCNIKKWPALLVIIALGVNALSGCGSQNISDDFAESKQIVEVEGEDPYLTGEKPVLNILFYNQPYDMNADAAKAVMEEITGYEVVYHNLPAENASEKLMLEIASGAEYDMIYRCKVTNYRELVSLNAAMDITELLERYGGEILNNVEDLDWSMVTDENGVITGIPYPGTQQSLDTLYGYFSGGIAFRSDVLEEMGKEIPDTIDEFYDVLATYKEATGNAGFTMKGTAIQGAISSAFGFGSCEWYDVDGKLVNRIRLDGFVDYVEFMQKLYAEGLMDNDMPINSSSNCREKFANNTVLCMPMNFWDIPTIKSTMELSNPDAKAVFSVALAADEETPALVTVSNGATEICVIPKNAKNPEHAMIWYNIISNAENCKSIYIGEEGVSYEVVDGEYYPIFPAFDEYTNADKYTGSVNGAEMKKQWMARTRKTTEMAEAFEQMNEDTDRFERYDSVERYATNLPAITEYATSLNSAINDILIAGIVEGSDAQAVVDKVIETWERDGGLECEQEINEWYTEFNQ